MNGRDALLFKPLTILPCKITPKRGVLRTVWQLGLQSAANHTAMANKSPNSADKICDKNRETGKYHTVGDEPKPVPHLKPADNHTEQKSPD